MSPWVVGSDIGSINVLILYFMAINTASMAKRRNANLCPLLSLDVLMIFMDTATGKNAENGLYSIPPLAITAVVRVASPRNAYKYSNITSGVFDRYFLLKLKPNKSNTEINQTRPIISGYEESTKGKSKLNNLLVALS